MLYVEIDMLCATFILYYIIKTSSQNIFPCLALQYILILSIFFGGLSTFASLKHLSLDTKFSVYNFDRFGFN